MNKNNNLIEELFRTQHKLLLKRAYHLCSDYNEADEMVQQVFCKLCSAPTTFESLVHVRSVAFLELKWHSWNNYAKNKRQTKALSLMPVVAFENPVLNSIDNYPLNKLLIKKIEHLSPLQKKVIYGTIYQGLECREIEAEYGIRYQSVSLIKKVAIEKIRENRFEPRWVMPSKSSRENLVTRHASPETMKIVSLREQGHTNKEISVILNISTTKIKTNYCHYKKSQQLKNAI